MRYAAALLALAACGGGTERRPPPPDREPAPAEPFVAAISVAYRGASPAEVETSIVLPLEEAIAGLRGVTALHARAEDGHALVVVTSDREDLAAALQDRLAPMLRQLPPSADRPEVRRLDPDAPFAIAYQVTGPMSALELSSLANDTLRRRIERLAGIGQVEVRGAVEPRIQLLVEPSRLASAGVTLIDLADAMARRREVPGGRVQVGPRDATLRVQGEVRTKEELRELALPTGVRLADVAGIAEGTVHIGEGTSKPMRIGIRLQRGADRDAALARIAAELRDLPAGVTVDEVPVDAAPRRRTLRGPDRAVLERLARRVEVPHTTLTIDRARAADLGIDAAALARAIALAGGEPVGHLDRASIVFTVEGDPLALLARARTGLVPLSSVVTRSVGGSGMRERVDRMPAITLDDAIDLPDLPPGYTVRR